MKKLIILLIALSNCLLIKTTFAQFKSKDNIASQPIWGPIGYDYARYYYLPDIQLYYNIKKKKFIYLEDGTWKISSVLPARNLGFNLYYARIAVINEPKPYLHHHKNTIKYASNRSIERQQIIRDSQEVKYMINKNHPDHNMWLEIIGNERRNGSISM